jgi:hypothetical protein
MPSSFGYELGFRVVEIGLLLTPDYFVVIQVGLFASFRQKGSSVASSSRLLLAKDAVFSPVAITSWVPFAPLIYQDSKLKRLLPELF